jgi:leader peptidase (prepilin peptidase)/N-methyltransferase
MLDWVALLCLAGAIGLLIALAIIDLKTWLLPNVLVAPFALLAVIFRFVAPAQSLTLPDMIFGAALGFGVLWIIRYFGSRYYGQDALGLGDVKLMGAAGLWLGAEGITLALTLGATAGLLHGLGVAALTARREGGAMKLSRLQIPAGPGFVVGILCVGAYQYMHFRIGG